MPCCGKNDEENATSFARGIKIKRNCTDVICLLIFLCNFVTFAILGIYSISSNVSPKKLFAGRDFEGNFCGLKNREHDFTEFSKVYYTINMTYVLDKLAEKILPTEEKPGFQKLDNFSGLQSLQEVAESIDLRQLEKYMHPVCVKDCLSPDAKETRSFTERDYYPTSSNIQASYSLLSSTTFKHLFQYSSLNTTHCPYPKKFCVSAKYDSMAVGKKFCLPKLPKLPKIDVKTPPKNQSEFEKGLATLTSLQTMDFASMLSDVYDSVDVIAIVIAISFLFSVFTLVLLRFFVGILVWISVVIFPILLTVGTVSGLCYSIMCKTETVFQTCFVDKNPFHLIGNDLPPEEIGCNYGYSIENLSHRLTLQYFSLGILCLAGLYLLVCICLYSRIKLAIAINKVAAQFVLHNFTALFVPIIQFAVFTLWFLAWIVATSFIVMGPVEEGEHLQLLAFRNESLKNSDYLISLGAPDSYTQRLFDHKSLQRLDRNCTQEVTKNRDGFFICPESRYASLGLEFWYSIFTMLWVSGFLVALGQLTIAGAVAIWYFQKEKGIGFPVASFFRTACFYHLGTVAFGSFVLALVKTVKWILRYVGNQAKSSGNKVLSKIAFLFSCLTYIFEKFIKFLSKNAYIQVALTGKSFCNSAFLAFTLIVRNAGRIAVLGMTGFLINSLIKLATIAATVSAGYYLMLHFHDDITSPVLPILIFFILGYVTSTFVASVFSTAVDAILQCFVLDEQVNGIGEKTNTPSKLLGHIKKG